MLDRSGSTADRAIRHLVRAAREAATAQGPGEHLAVLPFAAAPDDRLLAPGWISAGDDTGLAILAQSLRDVVPGGGTDIPSAILAAAERVARHPARKHRVLLLTDGDPDQAPDPERLRLVRQRLRALDVDFGALVSGMPEAARRLGELVADRREDVVLLDEAIDIPEALLHEIGRRRSSEERLPSPEQIDWVSPTPLLAPSPAPLAWVHDLEVVSEAASVLALARWDGMEPTERPFAASRSWGAGRVVALAWGPGAEP
ncbi:MAG: vWA domain-containing protein, partial [Planctomycetota bacterium]